MKTKSELLGYLRNLSDDDLAFAEIDAMLAGIQPPYVAGATKPIMRKPIEPQTVDGAMNPAYLVELRDIALAYNCDVQNYYGRAWAGFKEQIDMVTSLAKQSGIDLASYAPEVLSLEKLQETDNFFAATESQLTQLRERILNSHEIGLRMLPDVKKKRWASIIQKAIRLQEWCRKEVPSHLATRSREEQETWRYLHPIRYMLWTTRSHLMTEHGEMDFIDTPPHLIKGCMIAQCAEHNAIEHDIKGVLIIFAPRHGKTTLAVSIHALDICKNPHLNEGIIHHNADHATMRLLAVRDHFDDRTDISLRRRALFPHISIDPATRTASEKFFVMVNGRIKNTHKEGNCSSYGIHSQAQGVTHHRQLYDDPSDQKEQAEEGTRERTNAAISATFIPRLTGKGAFFRYICTRWHADDFAGVLLKLAKQGHIKIAYYSIACGGPEDDFAPLWPEGGYGRDFLRGAYARLGPVNYACLYQNDADSAPSRRVKNLVCYPREQWTLPAAKREDAWRRFFSSSETTYYLSVDPTGTSSKYSNLAGMTHSAFGMFRVPMPNGSLLDVPRLVFLQFWSMHTGQMDIAKLIQRFCAETRVDKILIETTSGFHATAEALETVFHIPNVQVIRRPPGQENKVKRLLPYAIHLETGDAVFPGIIALDERGASVLQLDPDWAPVASQLLRAGSTADTNLLDCVSQQLAEVSPYIYAAKHADVPKAAPNVPANFRERLFKKLMQKAPKFNRRVTATFLTASTKGNLK